MKSWLLYSPWIHISRWNESGTSDVIFRRVKGLTLTMLIYFCTNHLRPKVRDVRLWRPHAKRVWTTKYYFWWAQPRKQDKSPIKKQLLPIKLKCVKDNLLYRRNMHCLSLMCLISVSVDTYIFQIFQFPPVWKGSKDKWMSVVCTDVLLPGTAARGVNCWRATSSSSSASPKTQSRKI